MAWFQSLAQSNLLQTAISLGVAIALGTLIGAERQFRQRTAGLRTNSLVAVGAAAFVDLGMGLTGHQGAVQVLAYVVSGIGFLGAGVIVKDGTNIRGLNTAATLWCSASVGAFAGADHPLEAVLLTAFVLAGNTFLRPLVNWINRAPVNERSTEATYQVRVTTRADQQDDIRDFVIERLDGASYPIRDIDTVPRGRDKVEIVATLAATSVDPDEINALIETLEDNESVLYATWTATTAD